MNGEAFLLYVREVLAPSLSKGDIVVIDNLPANRVAGVRAAIEAHGAILLYLPPYSPDLIQSIGLRQVQDPAAQGVRTNQRPRDSLWDAIANVLSAFTPNECANYLDHAGYALS